MHDSYPQHFSWVVAKEFKLKFFHSETMVYVHKHGNLDEVP